MLQRKQVALNYDKRGEWSGTGPTALDHGYENIATKVGVLLQSVVSEGRITLDFETGEWYIHITTILIILVV